MDVVLFAKLSEEVGHWRETSSFLDGGVDDIMITSKMMCKGATLYFTID